MATKTTPSYRYTNEAVSFIRENIDIMSYSQLAQKLSDTGFATMCVGWGLTLIDSQQAYTDAATNVIAIFAQILMLKRYKEQWIWWLVLNLLCIKMWFVAGNWSMVVMYIGWTANCIYGWYNWSKLAKTKLEH